MSEAATQEFGSVTRGDSSEIGSPLGRRPSVTKLLNAVATLSPHPAAMDALSIASAGLTAATARYAASASAIASGAGDIAANLNELTLAKVAVEASAAVARTSADLSKQLVDILA